MRLHLGCGPTVVPGWDNVDGSWSAWFARHRGLLRLLARCRVVPAKLALNPYPTGIRIHDLRRRLGFAATGSYEAVYASHVLEHLCFADAQQLLSESFRVLRPGGVARILVPDLRSLVLEYLGQMELGDQSGDAPHLDGADRFSARFLNAPLQQGRASLPYRIYAAYYDLHQHKWMYDAPSLIRHMQRAGFQDAAERGLFDSRITDIELIENPERLGAGYGICVEGVKR